MLIVDCIEPTLGKLHLSTCPTRQEGSILGSKGVRYKRIRGKGVCIIVLSGCTERHSCVSQRGGCCLSGAMPVAGSQPRGEASPAPWRPHCETTSGGETFRGVCRLRTNQRSRSKSRGPILPIPSGQLPTSWGPHDAITAPALAATRRTRKKATPKASERLFSFAEFSGNLR